MRENLRVKEVRLHAQPGVRWIVCHNPEQAAKDKADRDRHPSVTEQASAGRDKAQGACDQFEHRQAPHPFGLVTTASRRGAGVPRLSV